MTKSKSSNGDKTQKLQFQLWWTSKTQIVVKLKNSSCDETLKLKLWWNSKTQIVRKQKTQVLMKLKNSNCDTIQNSICDEPQAKMVKKSKNSILTKLKLKLWPKKKSNCDQTQKLKFWQSLNCNKTQVVTKLKLWHPKLWQNTNCDKSQVVTTLKLWQNSNCEQKISKSLNWTKLKLWQNSKNQIVTKLINPNCDKTGNMTNLNLRRKLNLKGSFIKNILTPWQPMRCSLGSVLQFSQCFWQGAGGTQIINDKHWCLKRLFFFLIYI